MSIFERFKHRLLPKEWQERVEGFASNGLKKKEYWFRTGWFCKEHHNEIKEAIVKEEGGE